MGKLSVLIATEFDNVCTQLMIYLPQWYPKVTTTTTTTTSQSKNRCL